MSKEIYISSTPHETRLAIVENDALTEIYYERENEYTLAGSIYNGKVTRVLPGMQSSFVDIGLERDAFLYITDFMEEAGETADFEAHANGGSEPRRNSRENGRNDRGSRPDRSPDHTQEGGPDRSPERSPDRSLDRTPQPRPEPTDAELFTQAVSGVDPIGNSGEPANSRRGGRNRRDRNPDRNSDRNPDRSQDRNGDRNPPRPEPVLLSPPPAESTAGADAELGEGAPGADGSRRWRGRRGRRGNRAAGSGEPRLETSLESSLESTPPAIPEAPARTESTGPIYDSYPAPEEPDAFVAPVATVESAARSPRNDRGGNRNDRGDRNRRDGRPAAPPRVPRGFTPSHDLYQVDGSAEAPASGSEAPEAPAKPIILPGESLSKYRPASEQPASPARAEYAPTAPSEFVAAGWDGGFVLPGETLRPRSTPASSTSDSTRREDRGSRGNDRIRNDRGGSDRNRNDRGDRNRNDPGPRPERTERPADPLPIQIHASEIHASDVIEAVHSHEPEPQAAAPVVILPLNSTFVPPPPMPTAAAPEPTPEPEEFHETVHEFEPSEASASYRVDLAPPSEFRQSAPILEEEEILEEEKLEKEFVPASFAHSETVAGSAHEPVPAELTHEVTSVFPDGDMHSDPPSLTTQDLVAPSEFASSPEHSAQPVASEILAGDQTQPWFAPGSGILEEELLDDEDDTILPNLQARREVTHEPDPQDQETLEHAADLGTMLRDMSIDQITRPNSAHEDDELDDMEEDFLEEDQLDAEPDDSLENSDQDAFEDEEADQPHYALEDSSTNEEGVAHTRDSEFIPSEAPAAGAPTSNPREPRRNDRGRRDGRRNDRNRRSSDRSSDRGNSTSPRNQDRSSGDRERSRHSSGGGRQSMQATNLPAISDLLKPGQEILCQIAKEPIAKKGARITSHIALPGRFLVFMPTVNHTGVSRKIESDGERRRLKEILLSEKGDASGGFIVRTAASGASEEELRSDLRFLLNLWTDIKTRSESSKSPALIYHDLNLVERVLRDQVTDNFSAIWVDTETDYERILRFLQRFQPSLIRRVKLYTKETPLFEQFGITEEINKALRSKVWLKSGGSIVINQTEALVAIDINTGKFVGKTARLEDTIVKTNLDAIPEIVRQIRLRDLGGIIIIDFIDMDDRKNRNKVMAALEDELKSDRAPSKVLPFNDFGLIAITRKRVKQSLERTLSTPCNICTGTGMVKSPVTVCNDIYIEMRKMSKHPERGDVMLRVHPEVVKQLKSTTSRWLQEMEEMVGKTILVKSDPSLHPEQFDLH